MSSALLAKVPEDLSASFSSFDIFMPVSAGDLVFVCSEDGRPEIEVRIEGEGEEMVAVPTGRQQPCTVERSSSCPCALDCDCLGLACPCRIKAGSEAGTRWCDADPADACACHAQCGCPAQCPCDDPDFCYCADDEAECVCGPGCVCDCGARRG